MKHLIPFFLFPSLLLVAGCNQTTPNPSEDISKIVKIQEVGAHLTFLAADELRGRETGSPEIDIAAQYIATYFHQVGLDPISENNSYFQQFPLQKLTPPVEASLKLGNQSYDLEKDFVVLSAKNEKIKGDLVFAGFGTQKEMEEADVKDKIVLVWAGMQNENDFRKAYSQDSPVKLELAEKLGALALIEMVGFPGSPWNGMASRLNRVRILLGENHPSISHVWIRNIQDENFSDLKKNKKGKGKLEILGTKTEEIEGKNVVGLLKGTDTLLNQEYLVVTAHYDHIGVNPSLSPGDSINNGARDNAIGTVALMETAKYFSQHPPRRSVLFIAFTAEEKGLLGSAWYVDHPLVPLVQCIFNSNCDGAGYNDIEKVTVIGLERTSAESTVKRACSAFGLEAIGDPVPEHNLFERSDNFNFAKKGIPTLDFSPGFTSFDKTLFQYYHQPADEVNTLNLEYITTYHRAFVLLNHYLANENESISWRKGDPYEANFLELHPKNN